MPLASGQLVLSSRWLTTAALVALFVSVSIVATPQRASAQAAPSQASSAAKAKSTPPRKSFSSPQEAVTALYQAALKHDEDGMLIILGPDSRDLIFWTDNAADRRADTDVFVKNYDQMHRLVKEPDHETTLYVGAENWPLPIPLVEKDGVWYFDASLGRQEILYRRIGQNETNASDVLHGLSEAENEYYDNGPSGSPPEYAPRFDSDKGTHDGLYWPGGEKNEASPIGQYLAEACYDQPGHKPLHGYYFRILMEQGPNAQGGARKYLVNNKMTGGFAFVAFPAEYRSSGVKTFLVSHDGVVYEKDLGPNTTKIASTMAEYNPDSSWMRVP